MQHRIVLCGSVLAGASFVSSAAGLRPTPTLSLDNGYAEMYNIEFGEAHKTFDAWKKAHPDDPMAPVSDAAAYLFAEFERLHVLQSEFFTDDVEFKSGPKMTPDPAVKEAFLKRLDECDHLADGVLTHDAGNKNAQFAKILAMGLRCNYMAMIEKRYVASLSYMKAARTRAQALLAKDSSFYDAYTALGIENYMLGVKSTPVRLMLSVTGAKTSKSEGVRDLKIAAAQGHYLEPFARLLLAVAALRDKDKNTAREYLAGLSKEFPKNKLYARELARLQ